jgi:hypothetical protein
VSPLCLPATRYRCPAQPSGKRQPVERQSAEKAVWHPAIFCLKIFRGSGFRIAKAAGGSAPAFKPPPLNATRPFPQLLAWPWAATPDVTALGAFLTNFLKFSPNPLKYRKRRPVRAPDNLCASPNWPHRAARYFAALGERGRRNSKAARIGRPLLCKSSGNSGFRSPNPWRSAGRGRIAA